ncbi:hypothetical protein [Burkholderia gladioli]|uniref:hypothetical protein n=1 Tax=Burkholderia gladioli TaxID=28095 RepID=UPI00163EF130|nr:hypothetical protein [Burkholderia gladioli]
MNIDPREIVRFAEEIDMTLRNPNQGATLTKLYLTTDHKDLFVAALIGRLVFAVTTANTCPTRDAGSVQ